MTTSLEEIKAIKFPEISHEIKLLLQGMPATGKTIGAATFPSPVWAALERGIYQRKDDIKLLYNIDVTTFPIIPFYDPTFCKKILEEARYSPREISGVLNSKEAFYIWLKIYGPKLLSTSTLVVDSWTSLQEYFDVFQDQDIRKNKKGDIDEYYFWAQKVAFSEKVCSILEQLSCNVVVICHESQERDKITGKLLDKLQPLMQGKFVTKFKKYFSHCFRALVLSEEDSKGQPIIDPITKRPKVRYVWQAATDNYFDARADIGTPYLVDANYKALVTKREEKK